MVSKKNYKIMLTKNTTMWHLKTAHLLIERNTHFILGPIFYLEAILSADTESGLTQILIKYL